MALGQSLDGEPSLIKWAPAAVGSPRLTTRSSNPSLQCSESWFRPDEGARRPSPSSAFKKSTTFSSYEWPESPPKESPPKDAPRQIAQKELKPDDIKERRFNRLVQEFESKLSNQRNGRQSRPPQASTLDAQSHRSPMTSRRCLDLPDPKSSDSTDPFPRVGRFSYGGAAGARSVSPTVRNSEPWWPGYTWRSVQDGDGRSNEKSPTPAQKAATSSEQGRVRRHSERKTEVSVDIHAPGDPLPIFGKRREIVIEPDAFGALPGTRAERRHVSPPQSDTASRVSGMMPERHGPLRSMSPPRSPKEPRRSEKKHVAEPFTTFDLAAPRPPAPQVPERMMRWQAPMA